MDKNSKKLIISISIIICSSIFILSVYSISKHFKILLNKKSNEISHLLIQNKQLSTKVLKLDNQVKDLTRRIKKLNANFAIHVDKKEIKRLLSLWITNNYSKAYQRLSDEISNYLITKSKIPFIMVGLIAAESSFRTQLRNKIDAMGLCQIRYYVWKEEAPEMFKLLKIHKINEIYDPLKNVKLSEYILLKYYKELGNFENALIKYQTGQNALKFLKKKQKIRTIEYLKKVYSVAAKARLYILLSTTIFNQSYK